MKLLFLQMRKIHTRVSDLLKVTWLHFLLKQAENTAGLIMKVSNRI